MKKWLKKYGKWLIVVLGVIIIAFCIYGLIIAETQLERLSYSVFISIWAFVILVFSGILFKLFEWWGKD